MKVIFLLVDKVFERLKFVGQLIREVPIPFTDDASFGLMRCQRDDASAFYRDSLGMITVTSPPVPTYSPRVAARTVLPLFVTAAANPAGLTLSALVNPGAAIIPSSYLNTPGVLYPVS